MSTLRRATRSSRAFLAISTLLPALGACVNMTGVDDLDREQDRLDTAWDRFERSAPLAYTYTVHVNCECPRDVTRPVTVWVDRGVTEYLLYEDDGQPVPLSYANSFPSVEQLFDAIQDAIDRGAQVIDVEYDLTYGYPTDVYIDYDRSYADEELAMVTWGFRRWD